MASHGTLRVTPKWSTRIEDSSTCGIPQGKSRRTTLKTYTVALDDMYSKNTGCNSLKKVVWSFLHYKHEVTTMCYWDTIPWHLNKWLKYDTKKGMTHAECAEKAEAAAQLYKETHDIVLVCDTFQTEPHRIQKHLKRFGIEVDKSKINYHQRLFSDTYENGKDMKKEEAFCADKWAMILSRPMRGESCNL